MNKTYRLDKKEMLSYYKNNGSKIRYASFWMLLIFLGLYIANWFIYTDTKSIMMLIVPLLLMLCLIITMVFPYIRVNTSKDLKRLFESDITIHLTPSKYTEIINGTKSEREWKKFICYSETKSQFLLYVATKSAIILPKRIFTEQEIKKISYNLKERCKKRKTLAYDICFSFIIIYSTYMSVLLIYNLFKI